MKRTKVKQKEVGNDPCLKNLFQIYNEQNMLKYLVPILQYSGLQSLQDVI